MVDAACGQRNAHAWRFVSMSGGEMLELVVGLGPNGCVKADSARRSGSSPLPAFKNLQEVEGIPGPMTSFVWLNRDRRIGQSAEAANLDASQLKMLGNLSAVALPSGIEPLSPP